MTGDIFLSDSQTLTNAVNTVGVMGAGIAKEFKRRFPKMYEDYRGRCKRGEFQIGEPYVWRPESGGQPWILNFPTKRHWRAGSQLAWIDQGLAYIVRHYRSWEITSLALPALGCSLGGLEWTDVKSLFERHLSVLDIPVEIYEPVSRTAFSASKHRVKSRRKEQKTRSSDDLQGKLPLL